MSCAEKLISIFLVQENKSKGHPYDNKKVDECKFVEKDVSILSKKLERELGGIHLEKYSYEECARFVSDLSLSLKILKIL